MKLTEDRARFALEPSFGFQRRDGAAIRWTFDYADITRRCARGSRMLETLLRKFNHPFS